MRRKRNSQRRRRLRTVKETLSMLYNSNRVTLDKDLKGKKNNNKKAKIKPFRFILFLSLQSFNAHFKLLSFQNVL